MKRSSTILMLAVAAALAAGLAAEAQAADRVGDGRVKFEKLIEQGRIEMAPLAFMRGRTLNNCFVILDEAQNTTSTQMKMFLTRLGFHSKAIITGDVTQVDLEEQVSGLIAVQRVLEGIQGIEFIRLDKTDVVRHPLVARIIEAYERSDRNRDSESEAA